VSEAAIEMATEATTANTLCGDHHPAGAMLRLHGVVGHRQDPNLRTRLHTLEHAHGVENLVMAEADVGRLA
jgi:hypothetical protein